MIYIWTKTSGFPSVFRFQHVKWTKSKVFSGFFLAWLLDSMFHIFPDTARFDVETQVVRDVSHCTWQLVF